ncbi:MAG: ankyrin repeat domain-containing protein, partial [Methyloceanibacter sp.]
PGSARPTDVAKALVDKGADLDAQADNGMTALMIAASNNSAPMIGLLMDAGADPAIKNAQGQTAEDVADLNNNQEASQAIRVLASSRIPTPAGDDSEGTSKQ